jgi:hypothetical protein
VGIDEGCIGTCRPGRAVSGRGFGGETWANRSLQWFPDGQLTVDLDGFSPCELRNPADVRVGFRAAQGVDHDRSPADLDVRVAFYRTHATDQRLLILPTTPVPTRSSPCCLVAPPAPFWSPAASSSCP